MTGARRLYPKNVTQYVDLSVFILILLQYVIILSQLVNALYVQLRDTDESCTRNAD